MTCFTEVNHQNRSFNIDFAVANIKYNILGTFSFKRHFQNIDFQQNVMTLKNNIQNHYPWILWIKRTSKFFHKTNVNFFQTTYRQTFCVSIY